MKSLDDFHNNNKAKDKKHGNCKPCNIRLARISALNNRDRINARRREITVSNHVVRDRIRKVKRLSYWRNKTTTMLCNARKSTKERGIECSINKSDIIIPELCPIFNVPFDQGRFAASLDRLDNSKGYVKGNIWVISKLANRMKNDGSLIEILQFCENFPKIIKAMI